MKKYDKKTLGEATFIGDYESDTPEWHDLRKSGIGGSEIGTITGLNPYESAYTLWHKKNGLIPERDMSDNIAVFIGKELETPILRRFAEMHPELEIFVTGTWKNNDFEWMHANPDAIYRHRESGEWGIIEIKTGRNTWPDVPAGYRAQVMWYMRVFGFCKARIVGIAGYEWVDYTIEYDEFESDVYFNAAARFWRYLQTQVKPDWDGSESTYETVRYQHPDIEDTEVEMGEAGISLWHAQKKADEAQAELTKAKSIILDQMGSAKHATVTVEGEGTFRVATRQARRDGIPYLVVKK